MTDPEILSLPWGQRRRIYSMKRLFHADNALRECWIAYEARSDELFDLLIDQKLLDVDRDVDRYSSMIAGSTMEGAASCRLLKGERNMEGDLLIIVDEHPANTRDKFDSFVQPVEGSPAFYRFPGINRLMEKLHRGKSGTYTAPTQADAWGTTKFDTDTVGALELPFWPTDATDWVDRPRNWPSKSVVDDIISFPTYMVHKPTSPAPEHLDEGYLSFSYGEQTLAHNRTPGMKLTYFFFKAIFYSVFTFRTEAKEFGSYLAKTIMHWSCEELPVEIWSETKLYTNIRYLFNKLIDSLESRTLRHYWVPELNVLRGFPDDLFQLFDAKVDKDKLRRHPFDFLPLTVDHFAETIEFKAWNMSYYVEFHKYVLNTLCCKQPSAHISYTESQYTSVAAAYGAMCSGFASIVTFICYHSENPGAGIDEILQEMKANPKLTRLYFMSLLSMEKSLNFLRRCSHVGQTIRKEQ